MDEGSPGHKWIRLAIRKTMISNDSSATGQVIAIINLPNNQQLRFSLDDLIFLYKSVEKLSQRQDNSEGIKNFALQKLSAKKNMGLCL